MLKIREDISSNYRAVWINGKTIRFTIKKNMPISELEYPEFYDVKLTGKCSHGGCESCYMDSSRNDFHYENIVDKILDYFGKMDENQRPFQIAFGGGEPTEHPDFLSILKTTRELGIVPNYTTNGSFIIFDNKDSIIEYTKKYCGGVAVSCHKHLEKYWKKAAELFLENGIMTNFHIVISDSASIDYFLDIYSEWEDKISYFVLLPIINKGRCKDKNIDFDYLKKMLPENKNKLAFGAHFYDFLKENKEIGASLYEPEIMSKFLDLKDMKLYKSSFDF